jgi:hypothetical protein
MGREQRAESRDQRQEYLRVLQECHKGVTRVLQVLQGVTRCYKVLQGVMRVLLECCYR